MKLFIMAICLLLLNFTNSFARELYSSNSPSLYDSLSILENQVYGRDYSLEEINPRIERLENSLFGFKSKGSYNARVDKIKASLSARDLQSIGNKRQVFIEMLEKQILWRAISKPKH
ncbi:MAG: hypothetical protein M0C28_39725 [Candidatus Moduliflexus flocculans]|nr:hypothetical protein [Candidatus Moduliflexus flocculans]